MSVPDPNPARGVPGPGITVDEAPQAVPVPAQDRTSAPSPAQPAQHQNQRDQPPAQDQTLAGQRVGAVGTRAWQRGKPAARWVMQKAAPLTRRAAEANLVQVAAAVAVTALAAVVVALAAQVQWEIGVLTAPLWLFVGAGLLTGTVLGPWRALLGVSLYLVLGLLGEAWAGDGAGVHLDGPWAGVLLSLPLAAWIAGAISARHSTLRSPVTSAWYFFGWFFFAALTGLAVVYTAGLWTLFTRADVDGWTVFIAMSGRLPFDAAQCVLVATIAALVHRWAPGLLRSSKHQRPGTR